MILLDHLQLIFLQIYYQIINKMEVIYNKFIPFNGFYAMTIIKWIFIRDKNKRYAGTNKYNRMIRHESIHEQQILDFTPTVFPNWLRYTIGSICFYLLYGFEWLFKLIPCLITKKSTYRSLCAEQEAHENEDNLNYLESRPKLSWLKKIFTLV